MKKKTIDILAIILAEVVTAAVYAFAWWYAINEFLEFAGKPEIFPWVVGFLFSFAPPLRRASLILLAIALVMSYFM